MGPFEKFFENWLHALKMLGYLVGIVTVSLILTTAFMTVADAVLKATQPYSGMVYAIASEQPVLFMILLAAVCTGIWAAVQTKFAHLTSK